MSKSGFTLLEVVVAMGILTITLMVMLETQTSSLFMTMDGRRTQLATMLCEEKLKEVSLKLEREGWTSADIEEEGDFEDFGNEDFRGDSLNLDMESEVEDFHWAYTVRRVELSLPGDVMGSAAELAEGGYWGDKSEQITEQTSEAQGFDLSDIPGFNPQQLTEYLSNYLREVRVRVWWGENEDETDQVEITTHVINPSGIVATPDQAQ